VQFLTETPAGVVIEPLELYSQGGSELRPALRVSPDSTVEVAMDAGPRNDYK
jgi:tellurite resistance protein TerA